MTAFRVGRGRTVPYLDRPMGPQLYKPNRLSEPGRVMGESWESHRTYMGASWETPETASSLRRAS
jgi:hypothetical protein